MDISYGTIELPCQLTWLTADNDPPKRRPRYFILSCEQALEKAGMRFDSLKLLVDVVKPISLRISRRSRISDPLYGFEIRGTDYLDYPTCEFRISSSLFKRLRCFEELFHFY